MTEYRKEGIFEKPLTTMNGIAMVFLLIILIALLVFSVAVLRNPVIIAAVALAVAFVAPGFFMLQPNEAAVITLFGDYLGTERQPGLRWTLPWNIRKRVSVRARNQNIETLKVNDKRGNPVEIGAVVVWRVEDTAQALFDVEASHNQAINFDLPASMSRPVKYYLLFRNSSGKGSKVVEANFRVDF